MPRNASNWQMFRSRVQNNLHPWNVAYVLVLYASKPHHIVFVSMINH